MKKIDNFVDIEARYELNYILITIKKDSTEIEQRI